MLRNKRHKIFLFFTQEKKGGGKMLLLLLLYFLCLSFSKTIKEDYNGPQSASWLTIKLLTENPHLIHVKWCSELYKDSIPDINDCKARNIIKKTIYPGDKQFYDFSAPGYVKINTNFVSGFWLNRQADIVIEMQDEKKNNELIEHIIRINPRKHAQGVEILEDKMAVTNQMSSSSFAPVLISTSPPAALGQGLETTSSNSKNDNILNYILNSNYKIPAILSGLAIAGMCVVFILVFVRNKVTTKKKDTKILSMEYKFETNGDLKMDLNDNGEEEEEREEIQIQKDKEFLLNLETGKPNEAYFINLRK